ncbi:hypothetical protein H312_03254 [Anncaliia algerae PRA339]|uniref:Uncharacterized protein n=1 Tax=Anncaliia algerae PRA339 TaxID=1288291 RepID=A0A059EWQ9_9MICR|nr:hypothetical protein H312_03254 [Anncaliia algerae PRA339]
MESMNSSKQESITAFENDRFLNELANKKTSENSREKRDFEKNDNMKYSNTILHIFTNIPIVTSTFYVFAIEDIIGLEFVLFFIAFFLISCLIRIILSLTGKNDLASFCSIVNTCISISFLFFFRKFFAIYCCKILPNEIYFHLLYFVNILAMPLLDLFSDDIQTHTFCCKILIFLSLLLTLFYIQNSKYITLAIYLICFYTWLYTYIFGRKKSKYLAYMLDYMFFMSVIHFTHIIYYGKNMNIQPSNATVTQSPFIK